MKLKIYYIGIGAILLLSACEKANQYYNKLNDQPEVRVNYDVVYGVGDTMTLAGRLNPENNLKIKIGDAYATVLSAVKIRPTDNQYVDTATRIDQVKFLITKAMGIGTDRVVEVTSAGNVTTWPSIEIVQSSTDGYLPNQLQLVKHADVSGATFLYNQNGSGNIYFWKSSTKTISKLDVNGQTSTILNGTLTFTDQYGDFKISSLSAGGVDPAEKYVYFAALTTDNSTANSANYLYRFCRYDIHNNLITTLNRSLYAKSTARKTLDDFKPFQGDMANVRLFGCQSIIPDSKGNVYINIANYAVAQLKTDNTLKYLFKVLNSSNFPQIWNSQTNSYYFTSDLNNLFPGVGINSVPRAWAPDEGLMYGIPAAGTLTFTQYDLTNQASLYVLPPVYSTIIYGGSKPYISGSFDILSGIYEVNDTQEPGFFGYLPLPGQKVMVLYYQAIESYPNHKYYNDYPALGIRNFATKVGERYAPGKLVRNGYVMAKTDQMLNYDQSGMIYMTANSNTVIVKTQYK